MLKSCIDYVTYWIKNSKAMTPYVFRDSKVTFYILSLQNKHINILSCLIIPIIGPIIVSLLYCLYQRSFGRDQKSSWMFETGPNAFSSSFCSSTFYALSIIYSHNPRACWILSNVLFCIFR